MKSDKEILKQFYDRANGFFMSSRAQREQMLKEFGYRDGLQLDPEKRSDRKDQAYSVVNLSAPLIRAVSGLECMQDKKISFVPLDDSFDRKSDMMTHAVQWANSVSGYDSERSMAKEDALTCGVGAVVKYLDYTRPDFIEGYPVDSRIFPYFCFYDNAKRGSRLNDGQWCGYADIVDKQWLDEYLEVEGVKAKNTGGDGALNMHVMSGLQSENIHSLDAVYQYFWYEFEPIYDVKNPFIEDEVLQRLMQTDDVFSNTISEWSRKSNIDWGSSYWSLNRDDYNEMEKTFETLEAITGLEIEIESSRRKGKYYYRAEIARGAVVSKSRSYRQEGHPLIFESGYYDEINGNYYGLMRSISWVQDMINDGLSDVQEFVARATTGGDAYITGNVESILALKEKKAEKDQLTPLPEGTVITPKVPQGTTETLINYIRLLMDVLPMVAGVPQGLLNFDVSGNMTDSLYARATKQAGAVMVNFANNSANATIHHAEATLSLVQLIASSDRGVKLPLIDKTGAQEGEDTFRLLRRNFADRYGIVFAERPMSADERADTFNKLSQLAPQFTQMGVNIMPVVAKYANLDLKDRQELIQLSTPQPAQPDKMNQELLASQTALQNAQAAKLTMDAEETKSKLAQQAEKMQSEIEKNKAQAAKLVSDTFAM